MTSSISRRQALIATGAGAAVVAPALGQGGALPDPIVTVVFIVRHAEKDKSHADQRDPPLTDAGVERAKLLAAMLRHAEIGAVYTTPFKRSRDTALPIGEASGAPVRTVQQTDYDGVARSITTECAGRSAVYVGHTNTVGQVLHALGGPMLPDLAEPDYAPMYIATVIRRSDLSVTAYRIVRYGAGA